MQGKTTPFKGSSRERIGQLVMNAFLCDVHVNSFFNNGEEEEDGKHNHSYDIIKVRPLNTKLFHICSRI